MQLTLQRSQLNLCYAKFFNILNFEARHCKAINASAVDKA